MLQDDSGSFTTNFASIGKPTPSKGVTFEAAALLHLSGGGGWYRIAPESSWLWGMWRLGVGHEDFNRLFDVRVELDS